jgi:3-hydroxyisobutyrate dehydrogenase
VRDIAETNALLFDDQAIMCGPDYPTTLIISSTLSPRFIHDLKDRIPDDVVLIDAPMSGTTYHAKLATLTFMVGGELDHVQRLMPVLDVMGSVIHHLGPVGAVAACKVANNRCAAAGIVAVRRALEVAKGYGKPQDKLLNVMRTSSSSTWYGDNFTDIDSAREGYVPTKYYGDRRERREELR